MKRLLLSLVVVAAALPTQAHAESCRAHLPAVGQMSAAEVACYFTEPLRQYRAIKAAIVANSIAAATSGVSATLSSVQAGTADNLVDYARSKDDEAEALAGVDASLNDIASLTARLDAIEAAVISSPAFARYMAQRGVTDEETGWKMLADDAKLLWKQSERKAVHDEEVAAKKERREVLARYRKLSLAEREQWQKCPATTQPGVKLKNAPSPMEYIWAAVPKTADGYICYSPSDLPYLYANGFVNTVAFTEADWTAAFRPFHTDNDVYVLDHDQFLSLEPYRATPETDPASVAKAHSGAQTRNP